MRPPLGEYLKVAAVFVHAASDWTVANVQRAAFSTASVEVFWKSLWTTRLPSCAIKHLAHSDEILRRKCAQFSTAIVESVR
jgi:hypothetical protein